MAKTLFQPTFNYGGVSNPDITSAAKLILGGLSVPGEILEKQKAEERLALQDTRQAMLDAQNKQLFDLKMSEVDRANKEREALSQFSKGMLQPQTISGLITDSTSSAQVNKMEFTPEELAQYNAVGGDISKLTGSARTKADLQNTISNLATTASTSPEYQESAYEQAQRVAQGVDMTPGIMEELKKYQVADIAAQKERKKDQATYIAEAKDLETKIAELKTKQGVKADDIIGLGKEWGKNTNTNDGKSVKGMGYDELVKFTKEAAKTDSDTELRNMLKPIFDSTTLTKQQKEDAANNILLSSGAYDSQGTFDIFRKNVDIDAAKKANEEYFANLKTNKSYPTPSSEIAGLGNEITLLEARKNAAQAKANAYSMDRTEAAKSAIGSRIDELLGKTVTPTGSNTGNKDVYHGNEAIKVVENKEGPLTDEMKYVIGNEGFTNKAYVDKAGNREVETIGVGQTGDYKNKTFKETYDDRLNILKKQVPNLDNLPSEVRKTLIDNHYRGEIGNSTLKLINEGKYAEAGDEFLKGRKDYNDKTPEQIKGRMEALSNALKSVPKEPDVKALFENIENNRNRLVVDDNLRAFLSQTPKTIDRDPVEPEVTRGKSVRDQWNEILGKLNFDAVTPQERQIQQKFAKDVIEKVNSGGKLTNTENRWLEQMKNSPQNRQYLNTLGLN